MMTVLLVWIKIKYFFDLVFIDTINAISSTDKSPHDCSVSICVTSSFKNIFKCFLISDIFVQIIEGPRESYVDDTNWL
jgi:hypothetical protein